MGNSVCTESLVEYCTVRIPGVAGAWVHDAARVRYEIDMLVRSISSEAVELCGDAPLLFMMPLFAAVKNIAAACTYRNTDTAPATLLYSLMDTGACIQPLDVILPTEWTKDELLSFVAAQDVDKKNGECVMLLHEIWDEAGMSGSGDRLRAFLTILYQSSPYKEHVMLRGVCPTLPALLAFDWFAVGSKSVWYEDSILMQ